MKYTFLIIILSFCLAKAKTQNFSFDSLKVYSVPFNTESVVALNLYHLIANSDSVISHEKNIIQKIYTKLINLKQSIGKNSLSKVRREYKIDGLDVRVLFVFYANGRKILIGISPQLLMFVDKSIYRQKDQNFKRVAKILPALYENLYPKIPDQ